MVAFLMIVKHELSRGPLEARFADQNDAVQAGVFDTAHEAFGERIGVGRELHPMRIKQNSFSSSRIRFTRGAASGLN